MDWSDISIRKYDEIINVLTADINDLDKNLQLLSVIKDMDIEEVESLPLSKLGKLMKDIQFINDIPKPKGKTPDTIILNGKRYSIFKNMKKLIVSQYIDYQNYLKMNGKVEQLLSVVIIPEGKKYGEYDIDEVIEDIANHLDICTAQNISFFFRRRLSKSIKVILMFLAGELWMRMVKERDTMKKQEMGIMMEEIREVIHLLRSGDI
jgi:hypothetical protein